MPEQYDQIFMFFSVNPQIREIILRRDLERDTDPQKPHQNWSQKILPAEENTPEISEFLKDLFDSGSWRYHDERNPGQDLYQIHYSWDGQEPVCNIIGIGHFPKSLPRFF